MKIHAITIIALLSFPIITHSALQEREYNTWYSKDAILYDMTQTSDGFPVMLSISQPGRSGANMVVSYLSEGACVDSSRALNVNGKDIPAKYSCVPVGKNKIEHFAVKNAEQVNEMVNRLNSDFTLLLQNDIKVWAANIKSPKYGVAPRF
ncbi:hypothetical protein EB837_22075 [Kluyvera ascorbata]|uniref:Uncharacterized protein n=1 Tax=Kluyvera ascorbata TaxID=51288 RepID=A0A3N2RS61_9ENTR|nr:hypothetical protein [Kluyvera ascorbata]MDZ4034628.1 hypothetical protein [Kluyvera ascorbata]ROU10289.1 hypothetical protein EB837_22075 [Kluyvera ascorbata]